jgi:hypothetical protein
MDMPCVRSDGVRAATEHALHMPRRACDRTDLDLAASRRRLTVRARTAVGLAIAIVTAKAALTWVALAAWGSLPERPGFVGHWQIQLGPLSEWVAALFTAGAVAVALWIAGHESRARRRERAEADHAQARLVS